MDFIGYGMAYATFAVLLFLTGYILADKREAGMKKFGLVGLTLSLALLLTVATYGAYTTNMSTKNKTLSDAQAFAQSLSDQGFDLRDTEGDFPYKSVVVSPKGKPTCIFVDYNPLWDGNKAILLDKDGDETTLLTASAMSASCQ